MNGMNINCHGNMLSPFLAAFQGSDASEAAPVIVYISKMVAVESRMLPKNKQRYNTPHKS